jgi:hypothetical protein
MRHFRARLASGLIRLTLALSSLALIVPPSAPQPLGFLAEAFVTLPCVVATTVGFDRLPVADRSGDCARRMS